jgi:hypothetical protein
VLVIGGKPDVRSALLSLLLKIDIRAIDGVEGLTDDRASRLSRWADVVILWRAAESHHSVTTQFGSGGRSRQAPVIAIDQPDVAGFLDAAALQLPFRDHAEMR